MEVLRFGYRLPFLSAPPLSDAPLPMPSYSPTSIKGCCPGGGHLGPRGQGGCGACSSPFSRVLQPSVRCVEDLGVLASSHRPLPSQSLCGHVSFSDGDHSVCPPVCSSGRLDGLHRSQGGVSSGADTSFLSSPPPLRFSEPRVPVQGSLLRPFCSPAGLHQGHGSCFRHSPFNGYPHEAVPRRLARPVLLSGFSCQRSSVCPSPLSRVGDCGQSPKVQPCALPGSPVSGGDDRLHIFQGFSVAGSNIQAAINCRRISVLRLASREFVALASGRPFFAGSPGAWRASEDAFSPTLPPPLLGSVGPSGSGSGVPGLSSRPPVVAPPSSPLFRGVSLPGVSRPTLLVRRLGRGLGSSSRASGRFGPVGLRSGRSLHQRQGTVGRTSGSSTVPVFSPGQDSRSVLRQHHGGGVPPQGGWHEVPSPQLLGAGHLALGGVSLHTPGSTVSPRRPECPGGRSVSPSPAPSFRVVSTQGRVSVFAKTLAGPNRLICNLRQSPLFDLLLSSPRSGVSGHGRFPTVLERSPSLCFSASVPHPQGSGQAPCVLGDGAHSSGSILDSASVVCRSPPAVAGPSGSSAFQTRPPAPASVSASLPGSPSAQTSCLETLQRFTRAAGFSSAVAIQSSLARRPSSRAIYQHRWSVYRSWCRERGHSVSRPTLAKIADFLYWLRSTRGLSVSSLRGYRSALSAVFRFSPSLIVL